MALFLIQCAMRSKAHDYSRLFDFVAQSDSRRPLFDGSWMIETVDDLRSITEIIANHLAPDDPFLVVELPPRVAWSAVRMDQWVTDWLRLRRP